MRILWLLVAVGLGCGGSDDSKPTSIIRCDSCNAIALCYRDASGACPAGYDVVKTECSVGETRDPSTGLVITAPHAEITIRCR